MEIIKLNFCAFSRNFGNNVHSTIVFPSAPKLPTTVMEENAYLLNWTINGLIFLFMVGGGGREGSYPRLSHSKENELFLSRGAFLNKL